MTDFCPVTLPEEPTPDNCKDCKECGLYEHGSRMVWGEGNPDAAIMVILDNPGLREDQEGNEFVCGTRQTLQQVASEVGLKMDDLYITYILKRKPTRSYEKEQARETSMIHLRQQLEAKQPDFILCLGNVAVQSFFRNPDVDVKSLRGVAHDVHGYQTMVAFHPLAVRRRPNLWPMFLEDWAYFAKQYNN